jgi:hypothetical protein
MSIKKASWRLALACLAFAVASFEGSAAGEGEAFNCSQYNLTRPTADAAVVVRGHGPTALVAGGAGFIGGHVAKACLQVGFARVVVVDDLSGG